MKACRIDVPRIRTGGKISFDIFLQKNNEIAFNERPSEGTITQSLEKDPIFKYDLDNILIAIFVVVWSVILFFLLRYWFKNGERIFLRGNKISDDNMVKLFLMVIAFNIIVRNLPIISIPSIPVVEIFYMFLFYVLYTRLPILDKKIGKGEIEED